MQLYEADRLEQLLGDVVAGALENVKMVEEIIASYEAAQRRLPRVSLAELNLIRRGERPLSKTVYLLGRLEGIIIDLEDAIGFLKDDIENGLDHVPSVTLSKPAFMELEGAIRRVEETSR